MKTFKTFLSEELFGVKNALYLATNEHIPLTPKMITRIFGSNVKTGYHVSNFKNLINLKKLEGTKKGISCFTRIEEIDLETGVVAGAGIVSKITGEALMHSNNDAFTLLDKQGRRWLPSEKILNVKQVLYDLLEKYFKDDHAPPGENIYNALYVHIKGGNLEKRFKNKKDIQSFIKEYIDRVEELMLKSYQKVKRNILMDFGSRGMDFDEIVMTKFKIDEVYINRNWYTEESTIKVEEIEEWLKSNKIKYKIFPNIKDLHRYIS